MENVIGAGLCGARACAYTAAAYHLQRTIRADACMLCYMKTGIGVDSCHYPLSTTVLRSFDTLSALATGTLKLFPTARGPLHACPSTRYAYMIHARYQMPVYKEILSLISNRITTADIKKNPYRCPYRNGLMQADLARKRSSVARHSVNLVSSLLLVSVARLNEDNDDLRQLSVLR